MSNGYLDIYVADADDCEIKMKQFAGILFNVRKSAKAADACPNPDTYATRTFWEQRADQFLQEVEAEAKSKS